jgi:hypothetical protein
MIRTWNAFWFGPLDPLPAAVFRISLGVLLVTSYLAAFPSWDRFYAADGMLSLHDATVTPISPGRWSAFYWTEGILPVRTYWWLGLLAALGFTVGWWTRLSTVVLCALEASCVHRNPAVVNGEDLVFRMLLFYSCFAALGWTLSVDAWLLRARRPAPQPPERWPIRLIQINVALIYLISQVHKLTGDVAWLNGDAMYYTMINRTWSRWPWPELFYHRSVSSITTYGSLIAELMLPVAVCFRRLRLYGILAVTGLHVAIAVMLQNVTFFSLSMVCALSVFLSSEDIRRLGPRRLWKGQSSSREAEVCRSSEKVARVGTPPAAVGPG